MFSLRPIALNLWSPAPRTLRFFAFQDCNERSSGRIVGRGVAHPRSVKHGGAAENTKFLSASSYQLVTRQGLARKRLLKIRPCVSRQDQDCDNLLVVDAEKKT